jgi:hypothetical protein
MQAIAAFVYRALGHAHEALGDLAKAIKYHTQHLAIAKEVGRSLSSRGTRLPGGGGRGGGQEGSRVGRGDERAHREVHDFKGGMEERGWNGQWHREKPTIKVRLLQGAPLALLPLLPEDVQRRICMNFLSPSDLPTLACTCRDLSYLTNDTIIWRHHEDRRYPVPSFITLKQAPTTTPSLRRYHTRLTAKRRQLAISSGTFTLFGWTRDSHVDPLQKIQNLTRCTATITVTEYGFKGEVQTEAGTIHNHPTSGIWSKGFFGGAKQEFCMSWQERLPTNKGFFLYAGVLEEDGRAVKGSFTWSVLPKRVAGEFYFSLMREENEKAGVRACVRD